MVEHVAPSAGVLGHHLSQRSYPCSCVGMPLHVFVSPFLAFLRTLSFCSRHHHDASKQTAVLPATLSTTCRIELASGEYFSHVCADMIRMRPLCERGTIAPKASS